MALTDLASVKAWAEPSLDSLNDGALTAAITAASAWLQRISGRTLERSSTITRFLNGNDAIGHGRHVLALDPGHRPIVHTGSDLVTVLEEGVTLVVSDVYATTAGVLIANANVDMPASLIRNTGPWYPGLMNIKVTYKAGPATVDADVKQLANEVSWLMFRTPSWIGKASASKTGAAISFKDSLTPQSQALLEMLAGL